MSLHPKARQCTHIKVTGHRCGSPALRGEYFCYFHTRMLKGVRNRPDQRLAAAHYVVDSPEALQVALIETISDIVVGQLDPRRASLVLRALNIAQKNMRYARFYHHPDQMVREIPDYDKQFIEEYEAHQARFAELHPPTPAETQENETSAASVPLPPAGDAPADPPCPAPKKPPQNSDEPVPKASKNILGNAPPAYLSAAEKAEWHQLKQLEDSIPKAKAGHVASAKKLFNFIGLTTAKKKRR